jgi:hypothetical protein
LNIEEIKLRIEGVNKIRIQIENGKVILLNILYIPGLGMNLLFKSIFYKVKLYKSFNKGVIYIRADNNSLFFKTIK